jgi:hypothetical protein
MPKWIKGMLLGLAGLAALALGMLTILVRVTKLPGEGITPAGIRRDTALYIKMRDGVQIAVDVWLPQDYQAGQRFPVLLRTTRYGRDGQFGWAFRLAVALKQTDPHGPGDEETDYLNRRGFAVVIGDARGTGASSGSRDGEFSAAEISDLGELVNWAAQQPWSNGRVGTFGASYEGTTAELTAAAKAPAIKAVAAFSSQFDMGRLVFPGGIYNATMVRSWSDLIKRLDRTADICDAEGLSGIRCWWESRTLRGVKRVDDDQDGKQLVAILALRHNAYPIDLLSQSEFRDDPMSLRDGSSVVFADLSGVGHRPEIEDSLVAIQVWCGWMDATVCEGALSRYLTFKNPQRLILGSFSHELAFDTDPFYAAETRSPPDPKVEEQYHMMADFFDRTLRSEPAEPIEPGIRYYTMGEQKWHETKLWPPPGFESRTRLYFGEGHALTPGPPSVATASDRYTVNFAATTGKDNRWSAELNHNILYSRRPAEDSKLLVYTGNPLTADAEITGSPVVVLDVTSTNTDGDFFAYLEDLAPEGQVTLVNEGELRAACRVKD